MITISDINYYDYIKNFRCNLAIDACATVSVLHLMQKKFNLVRFVTNDLAALFSQISNFFIRALNQVLKEFSI